MKKRSEWPLIIKRGNSVVRIYRSVNTKGGKEYEEFKVASYDVAGRRRFQTFADFTKAKKAAEGIAGSFSSGDVDAITLSGAESAVYRRAIAALKPIGQTLDTVASDYAKCVELLKGGSLLEAVRYYAKKHPSTLPRKMVHEVVEEFIAAKEKAGKSADYLTDLRFRSKKFATAFNLPILEVAAPDVRTWLESLGVSARSQNNYRRTLGTLFAFAMKRGYLPKDFDELDAVELMEEKEGEITIYTPQELREIISRCPEKFLPFVVIGAFAGLRSAEIERLEWSEVNLAEGFIEVKAAKAKTASRRIVPILPNLAKWLAPYANESGRVVPFGDFGYQQQEICRELRDDDGNVTRPAFKWKTNALRHSFVSYRVADVQDVAKVALEAGNSPQMVFRNYRQLVTPTQAKGWFNIEPSAGENMIEMPSSRAA